MTSSNPAIGLNTFTGFGYVYQSMIVYGTANTSVLLLPLIAIHIGYNGLGYSSTIWYWSNRLSAFLNFGCCNYLQTGMGSNYRPILLDPRRHLFGQFFVVD